MPGSLCYNETGTKHFFNINTGIKPKPQKQAVRRTFIISHTH